MANIKTSIDYGIGRMLQTFAEIEGYDYKFGNFRSIEEAKKWFDISE